MRASTAAQASAILAINRSVTTTVAVNGSVTQWPATEYQTDAQMVENPLAISTLGGVAARQVRFKIDHKFAQQVSPYQLSMVPAALPLPIGTSVVVTQNFWSNSTASQTLIYSAVIFTGSVVNIPVIDGISAIDVVAQDASYNLGSLVSLPGAGVVATTGLNMLQDMYYSSLVAIDLLLRGCGQYLTAPPVLTGTTRTAYTILSIPGVGGSIPDIGGVVQQYTTNAFAFTNVVARTTGKFTPDIIGTNGAYYSQSINVAAATAVPFALYRMDFWFKVSQGADQFLLAGGSGYGSCPSIAVVGGVISVYGANCTPLHVYGTTVTDNAWHHLNVTFTRPSATSMTVSVAVDGAAPTTSTSTVTAGVSPFAASLANDPGTWLAVGTSGAATTVWLEALEVIFVPAGAVYTDPPDRNGQSPGIASSITATTARMRALIPQSGLNAWTTIQAIAEAEGALCWFDEDNKFFFEPQAVWLARRTVASARTFDASMFANLSFSLNADSLRKSVSANYSSVTTMASTVLVPAYISTSEMGPFARGVTVTHVAASGQLFFNPAAPQAVASNATGSSWYVPVDAASKGDPSATILSAAVVSIVIVPTATGFDLTVTNNYSGPVVFWNPSAGVIPQGVAMIIHGTRIIVSQPITVTHLGNAKAKDDVQLPDNPWRQDADTTARLCGITAAETYSIIPVISNIDVPSDPRVQLGDLVTLTDSRPNSLIRSPGGVRCIVVDIAHSSNSSTDLRMVLAVRAAGAPTGWILGMPGRSELGVSTYLPLPG